MMMTMMMMMMMMGKFLRSVSRAERLRSHDAGRAERSNAGGTSKRAWGAFFSQRRRRRRRQQQQQVTSAMNGNVAFSCASCEHFPSLSYPSQARTRPPCRDHPLPGRRYGTMTRDAVMLVMMC